MPGRTLYYCVHVAAHHGRDDRGTALKWGKPCDTAAEAAVLRDALLASGQATLGFVVRFGQGQRQIMVSYIRPNSAARIVRHYLDLDDALAAAEDAAEKEA